MHEHLFNKSDSGLLNKSSWLAAALGVTNFIAIITMNLVTVVVLLKSDLDLQQTHFRCEQIYNYQWYDFGHTLLYYLSPT